VVVQPGATPVYLHAIATAVPPTAYAQKAIGEILLRGMDPKSKPARLLKRIYAHSDIEQRHSVIEDYALHAEGMFLDSDLQTLKSPTTGQRNDRYSKEARSLFRIVGEQAIEQAEGLDRGDVTHVITVSCTGFFAPGPDFYMVRDLDLATITRRVHIGFMGCCAALPALRLAQDIATADPEAVILLACVELCTLHLQPTQNIDKIIATSVFADGAAAAIVSARAPQANGTARPLRLDAFATSISPDSEEDMAWSIGDHGFDMVLSTYVPRILQAQVPSIVDGLLTETGHQRTDVDHWAVHPGGKAILDKIAEGLDLAANALDHPRRVLRENGNMSSATILFVLQQFQRSGLKPEDLVFALAFGPGLTVESALLSVV
jgi:predicted naringenin-chalcone synthase